MKGETGETGGEDDCRRQGEWEWGGAGQRQRHGAAAAVGCRWPGPPLVPPCMQAGRKAGRHASSSHCDWSTRTRTGQSPNHRLQRLGRAHPASRRRLPLLTRRHPTTPKHFQPPPLPSAAFPLEQLPKPVCVVSPSLTRVSPDSPPPWATWILTCSAPLPCPWSGRRSSIIINARNKKTNLCMPGSQPALAPPLTQEAQAEAGGEQTGTVPRRLSSRRPCTRRGGRCLPTRTPGPRTMCQRCGDAGPH